MPMVSSTLQAQLIGIFSSMGDSGDNSVFSKGLSNACATYVGTGMVTTVDAGQVPAGTFTGAGTGTVAVQGSLAEGVISAACAAMQNMTEGGDDYLASQIAAGLQSMMDAAQVNTNITGTAVSPPPTSVSTPIVATGLGTIKCTKASLESSLKSCFKSMNSMTEGGDSYFASQLASAFDAYVKAGVISVNGMGTASGATSVTAVIA